RRKIHLPAGDQFDEIVVAPATSNGAHRCALGKGFENHAGVVCKPTNNAVVDLDEWIQFPAAEVTQNHFEFGGGRAALNEGMYFRSVNSKRFEFFIGDFRFLTVDLVDHLVEIVRLRRVGTSGVKKILPRISTADANDEIILCQTEVAQSINE